MRLRSVQKVVCLFWLKQKFYALQFEEFWERVSQLVRGWAPDAGNRETFSLYLFHQSSEIGKCPATWS